MVKESEKTRRNGKHGSKQPWYILHPDNNAVALRDMLSFLALLLTFFVVPFEVSFIDAPDLPDPTDPLWIFNRCVDCLFLYDMCLQFFIAVERPSKVLQEAKDEAGEDDDDVRKIMTQISGADAMYEFRLSRIFCAYAKGWLTLDFAAMGPSFFEVYIAITTSGIALADSAGNGTVTPSGYSGTQGATLAARTAKTAKILKFLRATRVLKLFRLLKLVKLLRAIKMLNDPEGPFVRLENWLSLKFIAHTRKLSVLKLCLIFLVLAHMQACLLGLTALAGDQRADTWWGTLGYCFPERATRPASCVDTNLCEEEIPCVSPMHQYWVCITWALEFNFGIPANVFIVTGPGTPIFADDSNAPFSIVEYVVFVLCGLTGALMGIYLQGRVVFVLTAEPSTAELVNTFCKQFAVSSSLRHNLQTYFDRLSKIPSMVPKGELFSGLSPQLTQQVMLDVHHKWLTKLPFAAFITAKKTLHYNQPRSAEMRRNADKMLSKIAVMMKPTLLIPKETPTSGRMYVIVKGVVLERKSMALLTVGDNWGAVDAICGTAQYLKGWKSGERIEAQTFCQVFFLDFVHMMEIVRHAPELAEVYRKMRVWGLHKRLIQAIKTAADIELMKPPEWRFVNMEESNEAPRPSTASFSRSPTLRSESRRDPSLRCESRGASMRSESRRDGSSMRSPHKAPISPPPRAAAVPAPAAAAPLRADAATEAKLQMIQSLLTELRNEIKPARSKSADALEA